MGLENLKSVWSNISLNTNDLNNKYPQDKSGLHAPPHSPHSSSTELPLATPSQS